MVLKAEVGEVIKEVYDGVVIIQGILWEIINIYWFYGHNE